MLKIFALILLVSVLPACSPRQWEETDHGVIVHVRETAGTQAQIIRVEAFSDKIFHVSASCDGKFTADQSLSVTGQPQKDIKVQVTSGQDYVSVGTGEIRAEISLSTGRITYYDKNDKLILKEKDSGRTFKPIESEVTKGYSIGQVFESPSDEAFWGLGQHQSDEFNYKGRNESLYQYNTKVSVPMVVSGKNYGILWDNYSLTKFGDPRDYSDMGIFNLYDEDGKPGSLTATYSNSSGSGDVYLKREENAIDYENLETVKKFPHGVPLGRSIVTWKGSIEPKESGIFNFRLYYAGYTKVWLNDSLVVPERWRTAWNPNTYKFTASLVKGEKYPLKIEWKPDGGISYLGFKALTPLPREDQENLSLWSEMGDQEEYYFIKGNNADDVVSGYRTLTGKAQIMPRWAMGYWQSRERYKSQDELTGVMKEYRQRNIPIDNIVLDWSYWPVNAWGSHEFAPEYFPDPAGMVKTVHDLNGHIMISVWPKFYYTTDHYKEFDAKGWMYRQAVNDSVRDWIGKGYIGSFYDAYSEGARKLFWEQMKEHIFSKGFDAWWMDASEPDILSNASMDYRKKLSTPTALGPSTKYFNAYALMNAMAIYDGQRAASPSQRVFLLTRSGFAGLQKYSTATWSGDIGTRWEDMKAQIPAGLNFALSGIPYWTMDIGGFCVENRYAAAKEGSEDLEEWRELNTRWFQFGAFCPLFRSHGQYPFREIYNLSPETHPAYKSMVYYDKLRYRLMPYIYSLASMTWFDDYTIMRALPMDFGGDSNVSSIGDEYMFGPSILVAPVYSYKARSRNVYLPSGTGWYDFYSGKHFEGGKSISADAPYERMPLFIREGAILPLGKEITSTSGLIQDEVELFVYTGKDCNFTLYDDEGTNYNYENGMFAKVSLAWNDARRELTIAYRDGSFPGMPLKIKFTVRVVDKDNPTGFDSPRIVGRQFEYDGKKLSVQL